MNRLSKQEYDNFIMKLYRKLFNSEIPEINPELLQTALDEIERIQADNYNLNTTIDFSADNVHLTDGEGKVLRVSDSFVKNNGFEREDFEGKYVQDLEREGIYTPSVVRLVLKEKHKLSMIQSRANIKIVTTSTPVFNEEGEIIRVVSNARDVNELMLMNEYLQKKEHVLKESVMGDSDIIFTTEEMKIVMAQLDQVSKFDSSILLFGESGTGKSVLAKYIHEKSNRAKNNFVHINCAAIPENLIESELFGYESGAFTGAKKSEKSGLIELANEGTLFLDEVGDMPLHLQTKLLQVIQDRVITRLGGNIPIDLDIRIISATNKNIIEMVKNGTFRLDLYYRLNVIPIHIPALRKRREDIRLLIKYYIEVFNKKYYMNETISEEVINHLMEYEWPGNVRELENYIERLVVTDKNGIITIENLNSNTIADAEENKSAITVNGLIPLKEAFEQVEKQLVLKAYQKSKNSYKVAKYLGISQSGAHRKIQKYLK